MNHPLFNGAVWACVFSALPVVVAAQDICGPAMNCVITRPRPVVTTQYCPQPVTTFCDVTETQMTSRQVVENVPITTCKNVTVDEGGYQMVWVPKPVTKQVAQTVMQQQVKTVAVPVQVTRRVPQVSTQMVPVQSVRYVNETVPLQMTAMASTCSTCGGGGGPSFGMPMLTPQSVFTPSQFQPAPLAVPAMPSMQAIPTMPAIDVPSYPSPTMNQSIRPTLPSRPAPMMEETVRARGVPAPQDESIPLPQKTSKFVGVPSAASVWKRQNSYAR